MNQLIGTENKLMVAREEGGGIMSKNNEENKRSKLPVKINKPRDVVFHEGNTVNNIIVTLHGDQWLLDLSW